MLLTAALECAAHSMTASTAAKSAAAVLAPATAAPLVGAGAGAGAPAGLLGGTVPPSVTLTGMLLLVVGTVPLVPGMLRPVTLAVAALTAASVWLTVAMTVSVVAAAALVRLVSRVPLRSWSTYAAEAPVAACEGEHNVG